MCKVWLSLWRCLDAVWRLEALLTSSCLHNNSSNRDCKLDGFKCKCLLLRVFHQNKFSRCHCCCLLHVHITHFVAPTVQQEATGSPQNSTQSIRPSAQAAQRTGSVCQAQQQQRVRVATCNLNLNTPCPPCISPKRFWSSRWSPCSTRCFAGPGQRPCSRWCHKTSQMWCRVPLYCHQRLWCTS